MEDAKPTLLTDVSIRNEPDVRDLRYLKLVSGRLDGKSDEVIAQQVDGVTSPRELYELIKEDGHPICPKCGTTYVDATHCETSDEPPKKKGKRKAKKFGEKTPLPPAEEAIDKFRGTLELLIKKLEQLRGRDEYLQSKRFGGEIDRNGKRLALGAGQIPPEPLTTLIAIEALVSGHAKCPAITYLIGVLHPSDLIEVREETTRGVFTRREPDPEKVNIKQLDEAIRRLRKQAGDVAKLIRGWEGLGPGRGAGEISPRDHSIFSLVKRRAQEGYSDEKILEEVNRRFDRGPLGIEDDYTLEKIHYLKTLSFEDRAQ